MCEYHFMGFKCSLVWFYIAISGLYTSNRRLQPIPLYMDTGGYMADRLRGVLHKICAVVFFVLLFCMVYYAIPYHKKLKAYSFILPDRG